jgi:hypothetical protein
VAVEVTLIGGEKISVAHAEGASDFVDLLNDREHAKRRGDYLYVQREDDGKWVWLHVQSIGWVLDA